MQEEVNEGDVPVAKEQAQVEWSCQQATASVLLRQSFLEHLGSQSLESMPVGLLSIL